MLFFNGSTVLASFATKLGAASWAIGLMPALLNAGSMVPQVFVAPMWPACRSRSSCTGEWRCCGWPAWAWWHWGDSPWASTTHTRFCSGWAYWLLPTVGTPNRRAPRQGDPQRAHIANPNFAKFLLSPLPVGAYYAGSCQYGGALLRCQLGGVLGQTGELGFAWWSLRCLRCFQACSGTPFPAIGLGYHLLRLGLIRWPPLEAARACAASLRQCCIHHADHRYTVHGLWPLAHSCLFKFRCVPFGMEFLALYLTPVSHRRTLLGKMWARLTTRPGGNF